MAAYEREFLVPYLMNVCSLHLVHHKLSEKEYSLNSRVRHLQSGIKPASKPKQPWIEPAPPGASLLTTMGIITFFLGFIMFTLDMPLLAWFFILGGVMEVVIGYTQTRAVKKNNAKKKAEYERDLANYNSIIHSNKIEKDKKLPAVLNDLKRCQQEIRKVENTLERVYSVNVIPSRYRNLYAAVFLYDWFNTSRAVDLEMALNMFVLEEIKEKLDLIIANQAEMILNQQMMLANQQKTLDQQDRHNRMMRDRLDKIEASNNDRNMYLSMIESNTATTAYFAAADYIRKIK